MKRGRILKFGMVLLLWAVLAFLVLDSAYFRVQEIAVEGSKRVPAQEIIALSGLVRGAHFFSFKPGQVEEAIKQNPWIAQTRVTRIVPSRVRISVRERTPLAAVPYHNGFLVLDEEAFVVDFVPVARVAWPIITGWEPTETEVGSRIESVQVSAGLRCVQLLTPEVAAKLSEINVNQNGEIVLFLIGGLRVYLGEADAQVPRKLKTLESVLEDIATNKMDVLYVDLRYERPVVRLRNQTPRRQGAGVK